MTAKIFHLPVRDRPRAPIKDARLDAATEWLLSELTEPLSLEALRNLAARELARPRDGVHRQWAKTFLEETLEYV